MLHRQRQNALSVTEQVFTSTRGLPAPYVEAKAWLLCQKAQRPVVNAKAVARVQMVFLVLLVEVKVLYKY